MTEEQRAEMAGRGVANRTLIIMLMRLLVRRGVLSLEDLQDNLIEAAQAVAVTLRNDPEGRAQAEIDLRVVARVFDPSVFRPEDE